MGEFVSRAPGSSINIAHGGRRDEVRGNRAESQARKTRGTRHGKAPTKTLTAAENYLHIFPPRHASAEKYPDIFPTLAKSQEASRKGAKPSAGVGRSHSWPARARTRLALPLPEVDVDEVPHADRRTAQHEDDIGELRHVQARCTVALRSSCKVTTELIVHVHPLYSAIFKSPRGPVGAAEKLTPRGPPGPGAIFSRRVGEPSA